MRITFLLPADDLSGGNRVVATYAQHLQQRGHEVLVVSNAPDRPTWRQRLRALRRGPSGRTGAPPPGHVALSGVPHKVLARPRPIRAADLPDADVLVATWWETARWMHAMPLNKGRRLHLIQGYEVWNAGQTVTRVRDTLGLPNRKIAISAALAREIETELGDLGIQVIPNAVDTQRFDAPPRARGEPPTVGFIYAGAPIKGADRCIEACRLARLQLPALRVLSFGTEAPSDLLPLPEGTEYFRQPAQELLPGLYARCDAWLFGSRRDSFGLPLLEAMACRTPVIAVPVGAAPDLLAGGNGHLLTVATPEAMAEALLDLCLTPAADWAALSERAHRRAHAYTWEDATSRLLEALKECDAP